jgi:hypothetical protein
MKMTKTITWALAFSILAASSTVFADRDDRHDDHRGPGPVRHESRQVWRGDIHRFHERDVRVWHGGHWAHERHDGRLGWWWVIPTLGLWYWYAQPVYPYPDPYTPPVVVVQPTTPAPAPVPSTPPPAQYWYYCDASKAYYPYVPSCPGGWRMVPATPSGAPNQ